MKKTYTVTFFTCAVVIAVVLAAVLSFHKSESKTLKVGFIYVGDASTSYTNNFIEVQNAIADKYGKQVKTIAMCNVAEGTEEEYLERLIDSGCELIFATSYNYGVTMKKLAEKYPDIEFCMATCSNANEEPRLENYHTFMGAIYQGRCCGGNETAGTDRQRYDHKRAGKDRLCCSLPLCRSHFRLYGIFVRGALGRTGCGNVRTLYEQLE